MKKHILAVGIIFLFLSSVVTPMTAGINIKTIKNTSNLKTLLPPFKDPPNEIWNKTYSGNDAGNYVQQTNDNGYIIIGHTKRYGAGDFDIWLIKTDINGSKLWNKTFGGPYEDLGFCVKETTDGALIFSGKYDDSPTEEEPWYVWLIKTDKDGNLLWEKKFKKENAHAVGLDVIEVDDGFLILGRIIKHSPIGVDIWLIKTDFDGNKIWDKTIGDSDGNDIGNKVIETSDGDYVIVGSTFSFLTGEKVLLIKIDSNGNRIWRKELDGLEGYDVIEADGGYLITGIPHVFLIKTNKDGTLLWKQDYGFGSFDRGLSVEVAFDGGYIIAGSIVDFDGLTDALLLKTDEDGYREWEKTMGGQGGDGASCVIKSNDDTYVITGITFTYGDGVWLVKIAPFENLRPEKPVIDGPSSGKPFEELFYSASSFDPDGTQLYYMWEWGDNSISGLLGPYNSGEVSEQSHSWIFMKSYTIRVKSRDIYGGDSNWGTFEITIPRDKSIDNMLFWRLVGQFPLLQKTMLLNLKK